jgi:hypothetical protein
MPILDLPPALDSIKLGQPSRPPLLLQLDQPNRQPPPLEDRDCLAPIVDGLLGGLVAGQAQFPLCQDLGVGLFSIHYLEVQVLVL